MDQNRNNINFGSPESPTLCWHTAEESQIAQHLVGTLCVTKSQYAGIRVLLLAVSLPSVSWGSKIKTNTMHWPCSTSIQVCRCMHKHMYIYTYLYIYIHIYIHIYILSLLTSLSVNLLRPALPCPARCLICSTILSYIVPCGEPKCAMYLLVLFTPVFYQSLKLLVNITEALHLNTNYCAGFD